MLSKDLLKDLLERTQENKNKAESFTHLPLEILNWKSSPDSWSVLECLEHLNRYGDYYIPEIEKRIATSQHRSTEIFKSGWLGNYFAKTMLPQEKLNKMKTFKSMNPVGSELNMDTLKKFLSQQQAILNLLDKSKAVDLNKTKTGISISKWIQLRLGDTFRVVIYHNQRHMAQAERVLREASRLSV
ncbi:DinB family protein [Arenibacter troitsensis]|uniref:DinB superfamily protein n=1 Tax=Arenibacter troitsensis TaxID=188872 RepID=A0A1X7JRE9_9FLAO|nr:DinB family protein [Arenibacter troitsensis]SMG30670.1 DinB superfamily protein [Arenibacter troitsensis]